jgi:hypothetical protein
VVAIVVRGDTTVGGAVATMAVGTVAGLYPAARAARLALSQQVAASPITGTARPGARQKAEKAQAFRGRSACGWRGG